MVCVSHTAGYPWYGIIGPNSSAYVEVPDGANYYTSLLAEDWGVLESFEWNPALTRWVCYSTTGSMGEFGMYVLPTDPAASADSGIDEDQLFAVFGFGLGFFVVPLSLVALIRYARKATNTGGSSL